MCVYVRVCRCVRLLQQWYTYHRHQLNSPVLPDCGSDIWWMAPLHHSVMCQFSSCSSWKNLRVTWLTVTLFCALAISVMYFKDGIHSWLMHDFRNIQLSCSTWYKCIMLCQCYIRFYTETLFWGFGFTSHLNMHCLNSWNKIKLNLFLLVT